MKLLTQAEFLATMSDPMRRLGGEESPPFDFWDYFQQIPADDFEGCDCSSGQVDYVWNDASESFQHVLINSADRNVFMVLILDLISRTVYGHKLLNLKEEYRIENEPE